MKVRAVALAAIVLVSVVATGGAAMPATSAGHADSPDGSSGHVHDEQSHDVEEGGNGKAKATSAEDNSSPGDSTATTSATEDRSRGGNGKAKLGDSGDDSTNDDASAGGNGKAKLGASDHIAVSAPPFGTVPVGDSVVGEAQITNEGTTPVTVENLTIVGANADSFEIRSPEPPFEIAPGETVSVEIVFTPQTVGDLSATLEVTTANGGSAETTLAGVGIESESSTSTSTTTSVPDAPSTSTTDAESSGPGSSTTSEEPALTTGTSEQPTTTPEQSTTTSEQSSGNGGGSSTTEETQTTTPEQPTTTTTTPEQPTTTTTTTPEQPTTTTTPTPEEPSADLAVNKTVEAPNTTVGDNVTFTIEVTNNGPDAATNVSAYETLDSGLSFVNASVSQGEYNADTGVYSVGALANGDTATLSLLATIESPDNTTNAVEVTSDTPDPNDSNNNDSADPSPTVADLSLLKNVNESTPNVGENIEYTLTLTNNGPNATSNVSVEDTLPDGLSFVNADASQGTYDDSNEVWTVGTLDDGDESTLTIVATVGTTDDITNVAQVSGSDVSDLDSTANNDESDEDDQDTVTVDGQEADLGVTKTVNDTNATVGDNVTFTITVTNNGPDTATGVSVIESLNSGLSYQSAKTTQGTYNEETNVYEVGTLDNGETATLTLTTLIESVEDTSNAVAVTGEQPDPNPPNNTNTSDPDPEVSDLAVTKTVNDTNATVGDNVAFTVEVTNTGPDTATNVTVNESLGSGLAFQSATVTQGEYDEATSTYDVGALANGTTATLTLTATIQSPTNTTNTVTVTGDQFDPNDPNNNESVDPSSTVADLSLRKTVNESSPLTGDNVAYTLTLTNNGPNATANVTVEDALPEGVSFVSADASQGSYDSTSGVWSVGDVGADEEPTLTIVATVDSASGVSNVAEVTASETFDPDSTPNNDDPDEDDQDRVTVDGQEADLSVIKTVADANATVGDNVTFTVEVTNSGPDTATNVSVTETLDSGLAFQSAEATPGEYDEENNVYTIDSLASGETATLTITATVRSTEAITNTVEVTSDQPDPNLPDNNDSATPSPEVADLTLTKTVNDTEPNRGSNVAFELTLTNNGPNATSNVSVEDTLPDGLTLVSSTPSQGSYDAGTGLWTVGELAANDTATLTLTATVESTDDVTNVAEVNASDTFDPNSTPDNNESDEDDQDNVTVNGQSADLAVNKTVEDGMDATVGDDVTFTVNATNNGPDTETNVTVNESLGDGLAFQSASVTQGSYDETTSIYDVGTLESGETATLTLTATIQSQDNTTNAADVTGDQPDPTQPNDNDSADPMPTVADLSLTKNVNESAPNVGENVAYTLTLSNDGPNATSDVAVADALPEGVTFVSADVSQGSYDDRTDLWTVNSISNDSEATLTIVATVDTTEDITNVAEVNSSDTFDPDSTPSNDAPDEDDRGSTTINGQSADLAVNKIVNDTDVTVGDTVNFTVEVTNDGPDAATNVAVTETLGSGLTFQDATVSQGSYDDETNVYSIGELASGETVTLALTATITDAENTANAVEVTSDTPDPNPPNNNDSVDPSPSVADLSLTKDVNDSEPNLKDTVEYTLTLTNDGPNTATGVEVTDTLPDGVTFDGTSSPDSYNADTGVWTVGEVASKDEATLTIQASVGSTDDVMNTAEVTSSDQFDPDSTPGNDDEDEDDQASTTVNGQQADLAVSKTIDGGGTVNKGDTVDFTIEVTNNGPDTAKNVVVTETLGSGLSFQEASSQQGEYEESSDTYTVDELANDATATLTITATVESTEDITNIATVTSDTPDPNDPNNEDSAEPSPQVADLSLTKSVTGENPERGDTVEYTLTLANDGGDTATNVEVTETIPGGLSSVSADPETGSYDSGVWTVSELANDEQTTLTLTATVDSTEDITNTAEVTASDQFDPDSTPDNDESGEDDQDSATVDPAVLGSIGDTVFEDENRNGVQDDGESGIEGVTVELKKPDGTTETTTTDANGNYEFDGLTSGEYTVTPDGSTVSGGLTLTTQDTPDVVELGVSEDYVDADFGYGEPVVKACYAIADGEDSISRLDLSSAEETITGTLPDSAGDIEAYSYQVDTDVLYAANTDTLGIVNPNTAEFTPIGDGLGSADGPNGQITISDVDGLEFDPTDGTLYGVERTDGNGDADLLFKIDPQSGTVLEGGFEDTDSDGEPEDYVTVPVVDGRDDIDDLAIDKGGTLYGIANGGAGSPDNILVTIDKGTGERTKVGSFGVADFEGLGFTDDGTLYGTTGNSGPSDTNDALYIIDKSSGTATAVGKLDGTDYEAFSCTRDSTDDGEETPSEARADVKLTKTVITDSPTVGEDVTFEITVSNNGPAIATGLTVEETIPTGLDNVRVSQSDSYDTESGTWTVGTLPAGDTATLEITAEVSSSGEVTNSAQVTGLDQTDPDSTPGNDAPDEDDQDSATFQPTTPTCNIQLDSVNAPESVNQGDSATIDATVTNNGLESGCEATATLEATGESTQKVDIAFLIDTSGSTDPYITQITNQLDDFANDLNSQGIDARYAVISYGGNDGYVDINQEYTSDSDQAITALENLNPDGGVERNYGAIQKALDDLSPREDANTFLIDVTDEDSDTAEDDSSAANDPSQTEIANQIDNAGASFIAVSPEQDEIKNPESGGYDPDQDIKVLSEQVQDGYWVNLFTDNENDDPDNLNDFVSGFQDIVVNRVEQGINRETSVTLDAGASDTLSFTVDTSSFKAGTDLEYTVTVGGETQTGTITITGSGGSPTTTSSASLAVESSSTSNTASQDTTNETTATTETSESSSETAPDTTTPTQTATTETSARTATTETETETETPTATETETATETAEAPTKASTETTETTTVVNTTTATPTTEPPTATTEAAETPTGTENTTAAP